MVGVMSLLKLVRTATQDGKAVFIHDGPADVFRVGMMPGFEFAYLWGLDGVPQVPTDGSLPEGLTYYPPAGGVRLQATAFPPDGADNGEPDTSAEALAEVNARLPELLDHYDPEDHGFHQTDTIDFGICLSGEIWLELDDGAEAQVTPGTVVVQNGTRHAWHNRGTEPCVMLWVMVGAETRT